MDRPNANTVPRGNPGACSRFSPIARSCLGPMVPVRSLKYNFLMLVRLRMPMIIDKGAKRSRIRAAAFVLADAIVAAFVLATIGGAFCVALSSGFFALQNTREDLRATQILMQRIEALRLCTWSELSQYNFQENYDPLGDTNISSGAKYFGTVTMAPAISVPGSASYAPNMCQVTVTLNWTNYNLSIAVPHSRQMQTQVARYGLQNYIWGAIP